MRVAFANAIIKNFNYRENQVFLTGDLGYNALEKIQELFGNQFINAGVAEQNMVTVAAGLAYQGFLPWVYSIAPFVTLRPFEQIRNDVCLHDLPVKIVANGGGYGYGIMGSTHHNPEDIGIMRLLPNMKILIPLHDNDVDDVVKIALDDKHPTYIRLNLAPKDSKGLEPFKTWRKLSSGKKAVLIGVGPLIYNLFEFPDLINDLEIWALGNFPFEQMPIEMLESIRTTQKLLTFEEHYSPGGLGESISFSLLKQSFSPTNYKALHANYHISDKYGSQKWHQEVNSLSGNLLYQSIKDFIQ